MCTSRSAQQIPPLYRNIGYATVAKVSLSSAGPSSGQRSTRVHQLGLFIATLLVELRSGAARAILSIPQIQSVVFDLQPPRTPGGRALEFDERTNKALYSLVGVCTGVVNTGTVLRIPADAEQLARDLGRLVRRENVEGWRWAPFAPLPKTRVLEREFFGL